MCYLKMSCGHFSFKISGGSWSDGSAVPEKLSSVPSPTRWFTVLYNSSPRASGALFRLLYALGAHPYAQTKQQYK